MTGPRASVVIPAHDDAAVIVATLGALLDGAEPGEFEVVVVCNGCHDDTAQRAGTVEGVRVVELPQAGKAGALQEGDDTVTTFPRIYLDSDTHLSTAAARALAAALSDDGARVAGMRARYDVAGSSRVARWYLDFRNRLPVFAGGIIGAGVYALDEAGRARFDRWPEVLGDDQFVLRTFVPDERRFVADHHTVTPAPPDLRTIVRRGARVRRGNRDLERITGLPAPPSGARRAILDALSEPRRWPGMVTWLAVGALARLQVRIGARGDWDPPILHRTDGPAGTVSVVVLTYNSASSLADCLRSLAPQVVALDGELLVVDNASRDDTVAVARANGFEVHQTGANLGFAAGCNVGAGLARGDVLVFANPDAAVDDGALAALLAAVDVERRIGPVGGRGRRGDGGYDPNCILGRPSLAGALAFAVGADIAFRSSPLLGAEHGPEFVPADGAVRPVPAVSGALMAVPRTLWDRLGGFDEHFFLYGEDVDLCTRAAALGWQPAMAAAAGYSHQKAVSSGGSPLRDVLLYRGKTQLYRRQLGPLAAHVAITALQVGTGLRGAPARLGIAALHDRSAPWWQLFEQRRVWRQGFDGFERPS